MKRKINFKVIIFLAIPIIFIISGMVIEHNNREYRSFFVEKCEDTYDDEETVNSLEEAAFVNINTDNAKELEALDGIGEKLAERIVDYRKTNGNFEVIEDIMRVDGIGKNKFDSIKDRIYVDE